MSDICANLSVIPQYTGTCWFNAILMSLLYSQHSYKKMKQISKTWSNDNNFYKILKSILRNCYKNPEKIRDYYLKINPEIILFEMLTKYDEILKIEFKRRLVKEGFKNIGYDPIFIIDILKYLNVNFLDITYHKEQFFFNLYKTLYKIKKDDKIFTNTIELKTIDIDILKVLDIEIEKEEIIKKLNPDYLILLHSELNTKINFENELKKLNKYNVNKCFDSETYKSNLSETIFDDIKNYNNEIIFNGNRYILDSCLLESDYSIHEIAGITCNNKRYVYNGWTRKTKDPAKKQTEEIHEKDKIFNFPCSLMEYDWDLRKKNDFCLNPNTCELDIPTKNDLCFNFNRGNKILIYVKVSPLLSSSPSLSSSPIHIIPDEELRKIYDDFYDFDKLTLKEIIKNLQDLGYERINQPKYILKKILKERVYKLFNLKYNKSPIVYRNIPVIHQSIGMFGFNSIITTCLYNSNLNKLLYSKLSNNNHNYSLNIKYIIENLINNNYENLSKFFFKFKSDILLYEILKEYDIDLFNSYKNKLLIKGFFSRENFFNNSKLEIFSLYIYKFLSFFKLNVLDITFYPEPTSKILINYLDTFDFSSLLLSDIKRNNLSKLTTINIENIKAKIKKNIENIPDILIINDFNAFNEVFKEKNITEKINAFDIEIDFNKSLIDEKIVFNGIEYDLESIILTNNNTSKFLFSHSITAFKMNGKKYVYYNENYENFINEKNPCPLIEYDWTLTSKISLNKNNCHIQDDLLNANNYDFTQNRVLIYIKKDKTSSVKFNDTNLNLLNYNNYKDLIKDLFSINDLDKSNLKKLETEIFKEYIYLSELYISQLKKYEDNIHKIREIITDIILELYNIKKIKKGSLGGFNKIIKKIKKY